MARIGWVELREERLGAHLRNFRAARVERIAVPEVYFEVRSNARGYLGARWPRDGLSLPSTPMLL
jgi:hypothetical protein